MERWEGKVAIVTGASVGIGAAIAKALVEHGVKVIGCARNVKKLEELASTMTPKGSGSFKAVQCDVKKEDDVKAVFDIARKEFKGLHILVNNAGLGHAAPLLEGTTEQFRDMMEVNVIALTVCTREAVKLMRETGVDDGHIINIGSMSGHRVIPGTLHFYTATKYAVTALTIGIRNELRALGSHIRVSQVCPGLVETEFAARADGREAATKLYSSFKSLESKDIADSVIHILSAPAHCGIHDMMILPVEQDYSAGIVQLEVEFLGGVSVRNTASMKISCTLVVPFPWCNNTAI